MTKYLCVQAAPDRPLEKDEYVIVTPDFVQDILECRQHMPGTGLLSPLYLRAVADHIGSKYDPEFPGSGRMVVQEFNGVPFKTPEDIGRAVTRLFRRYYPQIFNAYLDHHIKNRPFGTKLIYFVGDHLDSGVFTKNGIDAIDPKDIDVYLGRKDKKINKGGFKKLDEDTSST